MIFNLIILICLNDLEFEYDKDIRQLIMSWVNDIAGMHYLNRLCKDKQNSNYDKSSSGGNMEVPY